MDNEVLTAAAKKYLLSFGSSAITAWETPALHYNRGKARKRDPETATAMLLKLKEVCVQKIEGCEATSKIRPPRESNSGAIRWNHCDN